MTSLTVQTPAHLPSFLPRGARVAADLFNRLMSVLFDEVPVSVGQTRADEAEHVRALARRMQATDPGFAADLFAAAARHEGIED